MYVNMPAEAWNEWYACLRPASSVRVWLAAWQDRTAEMLKMMDAFSNANEYCAVALCVKASNLHQTVLERGNTRSHGMREGIFTR